MRHTRTSAALATAGGTVLIGGLAVWGGQVHAVAGGATTAVGIHHLARSVEMRHLLEVNVDADEVVGAEQEAAPLEDQPEATETPDATDPAEATEHPEATETPEATDTPEATEHPEATATAQSEDSDHGGGGSDG